MYLLFPGRHILNTEFQERYLTQLLSTPPADWADLIGDIPTGAVDEIVFAVTSSNKSNSRYNPLPFETRAILIYEFAREFKRHFGVSFRIVGIPHYRPTDRFADLLLKEVAEQADGGLALTPANCVVLTSTPAVIAAYRELGFPVLPAEYDMAAARYTDVVPTEVVHAIGDGKPLDDLPLSQSSRRVFADLPQAVDHIAMLYNDPILTEQGDLTETRNYGTYTQSMTNVMEIKYRDIKDFIVPGKIVDEGCADGTLIQRIVVDFPDSDIIGVDLSAEMLARANELKREGIFGNAFVFFKQQNLTTPVSDTQAATVDTIICNSTLHELWSYGQRANSVRDYLRGKQKQLRRGGRLVIRDVVGPEGGDNIVYLWCSDRDGDNPTDYGHAPAEGQSTRSRFLKFVDEFTPRKVQYNQAPGAMPTALGGHGTSVDLPDTPHDPTHSTSPSPIPMGEGVGGEGLLFRLTLRDAMEFISKMEYTDNWASELHEEFCFWSLSEWEKELVDAGLQVHPQSHAYVNTWRVEHRFEGHVRLFDEAGSPLPFPVTNMVLVGEKAEALDNS